jgi:SanA protein
MVGGILVLLGGKGFSAVAAMGKIYAAADVPAREIAIIYGAEVFPDGTLSSMLYDRVKTGVTLYKAGKVKILLMTADNGREDYNEPEAMRDVAIRLGVPASAIVLDYAGFRTFDSCYRARDIFKVKRAILVTQAFHLDRALLICNALGVDSIGVAADAARPTGYYWRNLLNSQVREFPSTAIAIWDLLRGDTPMYLGDPLPITVGN